VPQISRAPAPVVSSISRKDYRSSSLLEEPESPSMEISRWKRSLESKMREYRDLLNKPHSYDYAADMDDIAIPSRPLTRARHYHVDMDDDLDELPLLSR
jgi:hypothetical protein